MKDELKRFFQEIKSNQSIQTLSETQTKSGIIEPVLRMLGWDTSVMSDEVALEFPVEDGRIDYCRYYTRCVEPNNK